jgi:2-C-methyl-D-erythritol 4-phosphate cytidylyltransferase
MGRRRPKQYLALGGTPLLIRTLGALAALVDGVVIAVPTDRVEMTRRLLARYRVSRIMDVVAGGAERQESVRLALERVPPAVDMVVVHDAVRPFITPALVGGVVAAARAHGAATCGLLVRETVKRVKDGLVQATIDREGLWLTQTPQAFRRALLVEAHDKARRDSYLGTDDAVLVERLGQSVAMVPGPPQNIKITTPGDLATARRLLAAGDIGGLRGARR